MTAAPRRVWFHREYERFTGGHLKHAQYVDHVRRTAGFAPRLTFTPVPKSTPDLLRERDSLWPLAPDEAAADWAPAAEDVFFVAGTDWRYLLAKGLDRLPNPKLNLLQHVRHAQPGHALRTFLPQPAIRICVSPEVAAAVAATGEAHGPVVTIPNGTDLPPPPPDAAKRDPQSVLIVGYKHPTLATALAERLHQLGIAHRLLTRFLLPRERFVELLTAHAVAVCLPRAEEGFYLPALEAMAAGCVVVTTDCIGNRSFCLPARNCLVADANAAALAASVHDALRLDAGARGWLLAAAAETVNDHSLATERQRFQAVLQDVDRLWAEVTAPTNSVVKPSPASRQPAVDFMIIGVQKGGTTALGQFLAQHPQIGMAEPKEVHLFDAEDYASDTPVTDLDERYRRHFPHCPAVQIRGEATPTYLFFPEIAPALKRYNPALKLIVLLRDPVQRALSAHRMQRIRGREHLAFALALLAEPWRLLRDRHPRRHRSATREHAYRRRGLYATQLENLYAVFDPAQVLVLRSEDLRRHHDSVLRRVFGFLGVEQPATVPPPAIVFPTGHNDSRHHLACALLRLSYARTNRRLRHLLKGLAAGGASPQGVPRRPNRRWGA